jgi:hypothetical protein
LAIYDDELIVPADVEGTRAIWTPAIASKQSSALTLIVKISIMLRSGESVVFVSADKSSAASRVRNVSVRPLRMRRPECGTPRSVAMVRSRCVGRDPGAFL